jgi:hypothetical protein
LPNGAIVTGDRTVEGALNVQYSQPVRASSEYTVPFPVPKNKRPPATVGCPKTVVVRGIPNAHFTLSFGISEALSPAEEGGCMRLLTKSTPQPFQPLTSLMR